jgi:hypothetical protein
MHSNALLKTGDSIMSVRVRSNPKNNISHFISTMMNNHSTTTNESSAINNSGINNFNKNIYKLKKNYRIKKQYDSLNYLPLNTVGTGQSTWYHTKTVSSINKEKQKLLEDADQIMKDRMRNNIGGAGFSGVNDRKKDRVLEKSKELCLNNYMITQLKEKRNEINRKEFYIDMALKNSEKQYEIDYRSFIDFVEEIKKKEKKEEEVLNKLKAKKDSTESILIDEINLNKKLEEKCENIIKNIIILKNYGSFVHKVFRTPFIYDELSKIKITGKKYINFRDIIISIYDKNNSKFSDNEDDIENILESDERLIQQYNHYEERLVKILDGQDILNKEVNILVEKNESELISLKKKLNDCQKEYEKLVKDKKRILSSMKEFQMNDVSETEQFLHYIIDLGNEVGIEGQKSSSNKNDNITEYLYYCKDTLSILEEKEISINKYIKEIENILKYGDENDRNIIEKLLLERKKLIKKEKQLMLKKQQDEHEQKKKMKAIERAKRIVIRGRKVYHDIPPWQNKKKDIEKNENDDDDDNDYLFYHGDD